MTPAGGGGVWVGGGVTVIDVSVPPVTLFTHATDPPALEQLAPNCVVSESPGVVQLPPLTGVRFILFHPVEPPSDPVQDVAPVEYQLSVAVPPGETCDGDALKLHEGIVCETTKKWTVETVPSEKVAFTVHIPSCAALHNPAGLNGDNQPPLPLVAYDPPGP